MKINTAIQYLLFSICLLFMVSCQKENSNSPTPDETQKDILNVSYSTDASQKMDIYLPAGRTISATKILVLIHGGGWAEGDKSDFTEGISAFRVQLPEFAIFNINYRLAVPGANQYPAAPDDIDNAIAFISSHAGEYLINADKIGLLGASAGAHLALLKAYKNNTGNKIKAVVDLFGPTDLTWMYNNHPNPVATQATLLNFLGTTPTINPILYHDASPINYISAGSPATQIFHGTVDDIVPISESERLNAALSMNGVKNEFIKYEGEGHGWEGLNLLDTYTKLIAFLKENVR